jgi:uncharacterized protein with GYD domain
MPKYLFIAKYAPEGVQGVIDKGGSARREAIAELAKSLGGSLETFHFAHGEADVYTVIDLPDDVAATAISLVVNASRSTSVRTVPLIEPETVDEAASRSVEYRPPGG